MQLWQIVFLLGFMQGLNASLLKDHFWHLDPVHGAALLASTWIKNIHAYGNKQDPIVHLTHQLFHLDESQLLPTKSSNHLGNSLTPELIAQCLLLFDSKNNKARDFLPLLEKTSLYTSRQRRLAKVIKQAHTLSTAKNDALYLPYTLQRIMLGLLCLLDKQSSISGQKIFDYYKALQNLEPNAFFSSDYSLKDIQNLYYADESLKLQQELNVKATGEELYQYVQKQPLSVLKNLIFLRKNAHAFPPQIIEKEVAYQNYAKRPNCVEAALLDLVSLLFYDIDTKSYSCDIMPAHLALHAQMREIFKMVSPTTIDAYDTHEKWCALLWGKPDIFTYRQKKEHYEVAAFCPANILAALNYIFGLSVPTFDEMGHYLSSPTRSIETTTIIYQDATIFKFNMHDSYQRHRKASLVIKPKHAQFKLSGRDEEEMLHYDKNLLALCFENIKKDPSCSTLASLISLAPPRICAEQLNEKSGLPLVQHVLFTADLTNPERITTFLDKLEPYKTEYATAIVPIIQTLQSQKDFYMEQIKKGIGPNI